jgi:hypothetical protein
MDVSMTHPWEQVPCYLEEHEWLASSRSSGRLLLPRTCLRAALVLYYPLEPFEILTNLTSRIITEKPGDDFTEGSSARFILE